jgi:hypothetical protein
MSKDPTDVLIGGYLSKEAADEDYEAVPNCGAEIMGAVVVSKDLEGELSIEQTDHMARKAQREWRRLGSSSGCSPLHCWRQPRSEP